jgi:beta-glucanase (GH16 family)
MEIVPTSAPHGFSRNLIYGNGQQKLQDQGYLNPGGNIDDWHVYAIEWKPNSISWSIDGKVLLTLDSSHESVRLMNKPQKLMMNIWAPSFSPWGDNFNPGTFPNVIQYDYVKIWSYNSKT